MVAKKPRRWWTFMYCGKCRKQERVAFTAVVRTSDLADAARRGAGWERDDTGEWLCGFCSGKAHN